MLYATEKTLAARVKTLGESADSGAFAELAAACASPSPSPLVQRLAASSLGKLSGVVDAAQSVDTLLPLLADPHPQVRQYEVEYWGMDTPRYKAGMYLKQDLYMHAGKRLISLCPDDKTRLDAALGAKLAAVAHTPPTAAASADLLLSVPNQRCVTP